MVLSSVMSVRDSAGVSVAKVAVARTAPVAVAKSAPVAVVEVAPVFIAAYVSWNVAGGIDEAALPAGDAAALGDRLGESCLSCFLNLRLK